MISSNSNKEVKFLKNLLNKSSLRKESSSYIAEGMKIFKELNKKNIEKVFFSETKFKELKKEKIDFKYEILSDKVFEYISDTKTPQGVLAVCKKINLSLDEVEFDKIDTILILDNIQDPGNVGTIFRTAEAANIDLIILSKNSVDIYSPKVVRSAMGALQRIKHIYAKDLIDLVQSLKNNNFKVYATHLEAKKYYDEVEYSKKTALIFGNESKGISEELTNKADCLLKIPLYNKAESLNVAVASAIFMYELERQRRCLK